mmetsp:Transcript_16942/g.25425  ORF Transcript_16942/g.25425 Transcript_16942/m.25425 type:complete len:546 (-) Transcript_16942:85-1722(-)|eukprot:CAMPEP_0167754642 /NCGR_PEP_ID=MMETSP0110_2-20121227/8383_1 /TAXON_ID=629695 /ORGANISM="Gymnochlora sp., Strain CCMP2014" /LENGTH=545 /DNA_ID=CAMNT_0007640543 /DNA_START=2052 /DNA_END=3689 /DNA_ORIENTATION=-
MASTGTEWRYVDDSGNIQGPFKPAMMRAWFAAGYLNDKTRVSKASKPEMKDFKKIGDFQGKPFEESENDEKELEGDDEDDDDAKQPMEEEEAEDDMMIPEEQWEYKDDAGNVQGPYPDSSMQQWYQAGFFNPDTEIRSAGSTQDFESIKKRIPDFLPEEVREAFTIAAKKREAEEGKMYIYEDDDGKEQGPFSEEQMRRWYRDGYFHEGTKVKKSNETSAYPLGTKQCNFKYLPRPIAPPAPKAPSKPAPQIPTQPQVPNSMGSVPSSQSAPWGGGAAGEGAQAPPPPPTLKSGLGIGDEKSKWFYLDDSDNKQGPWTTPQMRSWFNKGMLRSTVRVRLTTDPENLYIPLAHRLAAFKLPPGQAEVNAAAAANAARAMAQSNFPIPHRPGPMGPMGARPQPSMGRGNAIPGGQHMAMQETLDPVSAFSKTLDRIDQASGNRPNNVGAYAGGMQRAPLPNAFRDPKSNVNPYAAMASFNKRSGRFSHVGAMSHWQNIGRPEDSAGRQMSYYFDFNNWQDKRNAQMAANKARSAERVRKNRLRRGEL